MHKLNFWTFIIILVFVIGILFLNRSQQEEYNSIKETLNNSEAKLEIAKDIQNKVDDNQTILEEATETLKLPEENPDEDYFEVCKFKILSRQRTKYLPWHYGLKNICDYKILERLELFTGLKPYEYYLIEFGQSDYYGAQYVGAGKIILSNKNPREKFINYLILRMVAVSYTEDINLPYWLAVGIPEYIGNQASNIYQSYDEDAKGIIKDLLEVVEEDKFKDLLIDIQDLNMSYDLSEDSKTEKVISLIETKYGLLDSGLKNRIYEINQLD
ncbi:MAG: hypothetical protein Q8L27_04080 [archaeon]|nr:hypothetical protein [archaeon]